MHNETTSLFNYQNAFAVFSFFLEPSHESNPFGGWKMAVFECLDAIMENGSPLSGAHKDTFSTERLVESTCM